MVFILTFEMFDDAITKPVYFYKAIGIVRTYWNPRQFTNANRRTQFGRQLI